MSDDERHIEIVAGHFVLELGDPDCPQEVRDECADWLAANERHRRVFDAIQGAWTATLVLARRSYARSH
jgi:ferric-dicitrate binding protein FerR (iron transport regulator)